MLLTDSATKIKIKMTLIASNFILALIVLFLKFWVYYKFTPCANFYNSSSLMPLFGIYPVQWSKTFACDIIVLPISALLVWHYTD